MKVAADHHVAINGMLKQDTSTVHDLSAFSYKARVKGCRDVSVIYAYDIEAMEPICTEVFPGNSIDTVPYRSFILNNDIKIELEALGLSTPVPGPEPKKRGRPKKELQEQKPKRPRRRPRKNP